MASGRNYDSTKNGTGNGNVPMNDLGKVNQSLLPHLESLERIIALPCVGAAWQQSQDVYGKVKGKSGNRHLF